MEPKILCIYHDDCIDGFAAAWVVGKHFGFQNVEFVASGYADPMPDIAGRDVYIVDFSYKPEMLLPVLGQAQSVTLIDHHKSSLTDWEKALYNPETPNLDKLHFHHHSDECGATATWKYFQEVQANDPVLPAPHLFRYVKDYDLWVKQYDCTDKLVAAIKARGILLHQSWEAFSELVKLFDDDLARWHLIDDMVEEGGFVLKAAETSILNILRCSSGLVQFAGYTVPMSPMPHQYASEACAILSVGHPFAMTYEDSLVKRERRFSLRSQKDSGVDVEQIARNMGGGGHEHSAGFVVSLERDLGTYIRFL